MDTCPNRLDKVQMNVGKVGVCVAVCCSVAYDWISELSKTHHAVFWRPLLHFDLGLKNWVKLRQALALLHCLLLGLARTWLRSDFSAVLIINPGLAMSVTHSATVVFEQFQRWIALGADERKGYIIYNCQQSLSSHHHDQGVFFIPVKTSLMKN